MSTVPTRRRSRRVTLAAIMALFVGLATTSASASTAPATTEPPDPELDMAGNEVGTTAVEPITLTATYGAQLDRPRGQVLARFVEEVERASGGAIKIEVTSENAESEQQWRDGDFDILLTPARTLDTMGVTTLDVLSLPFVVQDDDQADRVASSDVADTMLAGLSGIDATGLVLAPITQNHLTIYGDAPLRTIEQLHTGIRMFPESNVVSDLFELIGGHVVHLNGQEWVDAIDSGDALAAEYPTALAAAVPAPMSMATNFTMFYDFGVVAIRNDSLAELSTQQAEALRAASAATVQRQIDERVREEEAFAQACSEGATLTAAPYALMADIGAAVDDYIVKMLEDPTTGDLYDAVRTAAGINKVPPPVECTLSDVTDYVPPDPPSTELPEGVYRAEVGTSDQLYVRGVPPLDAQNNAADYLEFTIEDGGAVYEDHGVGSYTLDDRGVISAEDDWGPIDQKTWWEASDGIRMEYLPRDDPQLRWDEWELAMMGWSHLVSVD
jgi:TRAP-type C4-dicarboxylate transport system substrate-binding protein